MTKRRDKELKGSEHRRYLENKMTPGERNRYEKMVQRDPFAGEAAEGFQTVSGEELDSDITALRERLSDRINTGSKRKIVSYAVAAATIFIISTFILVREARKPSLLLSDNLAAEKVREDTTFSSERIEEVMIKADEIKESSKKEIASSKKSTTPAATVQKDSQLLSIAAEDEVTLAGEISVPVIDIPVPSASKKEMAPLREKGAVAPVITGQVVSSLDGEPIPGVTIALQGKAAGISTDIDGRFSINADTSSILTARFIGMRSVEIPAGQAGREKIVMDPDVMSLDEVVVVAAGTARKSEWSSSGSVTVIDMTTIDNISDYTSAMPEGGYAALKKYVDENSRFPEGYENSNREVVRLKFTVTMWGEVTNIEVVRSPGKPFSDEAIRLLGSGPGWVPPSRDGVAVAGSVTVRIVIERK